MSIQKIMASAKKAIEIMYDKKATIKRHQEITKENGADGVEWVPIYLDVPGRLSTIGVQTLKNASLEDVNRIENEVKFIMPSEYSILAGDEFTIGSVLYETSREPFKYTSHQEVILVRKGYA